MKALVGLCLAACILATGGNEIIYAGPGGGSGTGNDPSSSQNSEYDTRDAEITFASYLSDVWFTRSGTSRDNDKNLLEVIVGQKAVAGFTLDSPAMSTTEYDVKYKGAVVLHYTNAGKKSEASIPNTAAATALKTYIKDKDWYGENLYLGWAAKKVRVYKPRDAANYQEYTTTDKLERDILNNDLTIKLGGYTYNVLPDQFITMWAHIEPFKAMPDETWEKIRDVVEEKNRSGKNYKITESQPVERDGLCIRLGSVMDLTDGDKTCTITFNYNGGRDPYNKTSKTETYPVGQEIRFPDVDLSGYELWGWSTTQYPKNTTQAKIKAYENGTILHDKDLYSMYINKSGSMTFYAVWDTQYPGDDHIHIWKEKEKYVTCPDCHVRYLASVERTCSSCGETEFEEYDHRCVISYVEYHKCNCTHCNVRPEGSDKRYECNASNSPQFVVLPSNTFTLTAHNLIAWTTAPDGRGQYYPVGYKYYFDGEDGRLYAGDTLELYPVFELRTARVTFNYNTSVLYDTTSLVTGITSKSVSMGMEYGDLPTPSCFGYDFGGWYNPLYDWIVTSEDVHPSYDDVTMTAQWIPKKGSVTFDMNIPAGVTESVNTFFDGRTVQAEYGKPWKEIEGNYFELTPYIEGYDFLGYYVDDNDLMPVDVNSAFGYTGNVTVVARWRPKCYLYQLYPNGGTFDDGAEVKTFEYTYGIAFEGLPTASDIHREGYDFGGWCIDKRGEGTIYDNGTLNTREKNSPLYAVWIPHKHTMTFNYCLDWKRTAVNPVGADEATRTVKVGDKVGILPEPSREGYEFMGWTYDYEIDPEFGNRIHGVIKIDDEGNSNRLNAITRYLKDEDITVYAVWQAKTVRIGYDFNTDYTEEMPVPDEPDYTVDDNGGEK